MLYFWHWWLFFAIMLPFYNGVHTYSHNLCPVSNSNGLRTWGSNCQHLCHCINEEACNSRGYCVKGCMHGWTRPTPRGSCSIRILNNSTPTVTLFGGSNDKNNNKKRVERDAFLERKTQILEISQDDDCVKEESGVTIKSTRIITDPPILLHEFTVIFKVKPRTGDITKATFSLRSFKNSVRRELKNHLPDTKNMLSVKSLQNVLVDSIIITVTTITVRRDCTPAVIDGYILVGKPICPYGTWGIRCERNCSCQCRFSECHPTSGRCLAKGLVCPAETFGQLCSSNCSSGCFGSPRECHPLTGQCKDCEEKNKTGGCRPPLTGEEVIQRDDTCSNTSSEDSINPRSSLFGLNKSTQSEKNRYAVGIIVVVFLIMFIIICCGYVQVVQYCARRRMRDQMVNLEAARRRQSSMATYTEFKKEFMEMENMRRANLFDRNRSLEQSAKQSSRERQVAFDVKSQASTSYSTPVEPRMLVSSKPASKIRPSQNP